MLSMLFRKSPIDAFHDLIDAIEEFLRRLHPQPLCSRSKLIEQALQAVGDNVVSETEKAQLRNLAEQIENCIETYKGYGENLNTENAVRGLIIEYPTSDTACFEKVRGDEFLRYAADVAAQCEDCLLDIANGTATENGVSAITLEAERVVSAYERYCDTIKEYVEKAARTHGKER